MDQFIISIGAKVSEYTVAPVVHELGYSCHYKTNIANLKTKIRYLEAAQIRMQHSVDEATRNAKEIEADVQNWLERVIKISKEAEDFFKHEDHANTMCSWKFFQMLVSRHKLSKKAETIAKAIDTEIQLGTTILSLKLSYAVPPKEHDIEIGLEGYMAFRSRISTFNKIMDALRNPNVRMVGLYGMAGIGKTMLAKEIARQANEEKLFNKEIIVSVSQTPDVKKIQREIAEKLGLKLDEESMSVRAERLCRRLRQEMKILLVLDDVWEKLELHQLGITFGNDSNQCKMLLTSRFRDVVEIDMGADKIFLLGELSDNEAKGFFGKIIGDSTMSDPDFQRLATDIVEECAGLPIAIETIANALKNKTSSIWKNALQELRIRSPINIKGMHDKVYKPIKLSYEYIESDEAKLMLLYIGLYPEDYYIHFSTFMICGIGLGLFQGIRELEEAEHKVLTLAENLKSCCFLTDGAQPCTVKMHDVIHDVVTSIGSLERQMFNLRNYVPELEDSRKLKDATAVSLLYSSDDSQLPERLECPQLKFLLVLCYDLSLWRDRHSQISDHFFEEMKELRVLELFTLCLTTLPPSFRFLQNLESLGLYSCDLGDVALIGELKSLKILHIVGSNIVELPKQIGQLTRLQLLNVSNCPQLEVIEHNVILSLIHLEKFYLQGSFTKWDMDRGSCDRRNAGLIELKNLSRLSTLHIDIPDVDIVPKDLFCMKLKRYQILIGRFPTNSYYMFIMFSSNWSRILGVDELDLRRLRDDHGLKMLLETSEVLNLRRSKGLKSLVYDLDPEGLPQLKNLIIVKNDEMVYIINSMEQNHPCCAFLSLELVYLEKLMNLEKISYGKLSTDTFGKLRVVKVIHCDRLKNLFSFSIAKQLEEIEVIQCKMLREIVYLRDDDPSIIPTEANDKFAFPKLSSLIIESSPKLVHFFDSELKTTFTSRRKDGHPLPLFNKMVAFPSLKSLVLSKLDSEMLWPGQLPETFNMQNLTTLIVNSCHSLKHVSSFAMARSLVQLEHLEVSQCSVMEEVIAINDIRDLKRMDKKLLPNLKFLHLKGLRNLKRFCSKGCLEFPTMEGLNIDACPKFEVVDLLGGIKNLETFHLSHLDIVELPRELGCLTCLRSLTLRHCPKLEMIEPNIISSLISLEELNMENSFAKWEIENSNACLSELKNLARLSTLRLAIPDVNGFPKDLFHIKLGRYNINIGENELMPEKFHISRMLDLKLETSSLLEEHSALRMLMKGSEELGLNGLEGLSNVVYDLDWEGFPQLKFFRFQNNVGIQYIINSMEEIHPYGAFVSLESLVLENLVNLEKLSHGKLTGKCFGKLREIDVRNCNRLKSLFSLSEARILLKLEEIRVAACNMMEEIVMHEIEDDHNQNVSNKAANNQIEFPELYSLKLKSLPRFLQVFTEMKTRSTCQSTEEEMVSNFAVPFFNEKVKFPKLETLTLMGIATLSAIWNCQYEGQVDDEEEHAGILSRLEGLKLSELPQLKHLWEEDFHQGRAFKNLKTLIVNGCDRLKKLIPSPISFKNLRFLRVSKCHGMENLLTSSTAKSLTQLRGMSVTECRRMTQIVADDDKGSDIEIEEAEIVFDHLEVLELVDIPTLMSFYSGSNHILRFPNLKGLFVSSCCQMQSFCNGKISTPNLKRLILSALTVTKKDEDGDGNGDGDEDKDGSDDNDILEWDDEEWDFDEEEYSDRPMMQLKEGDINATIRHLSESRPVDT